MKKILYAAAFIAIALVLFQSSSSVFSAKRVVSAEQQKQDHELAETIRRLSNRSAEGLVAETFRDGGVHVDLHGRFQNVMIGRIDDDSEPLAACITGLGEANSFFGRDLETGEILPRTEFASATKKIAADHGLTEREYNFYLDMIRTVQPELSPGSATFTIFNNDGAGEGFNDPNPAFTVGEGGNMGATVGAQRLNVFNHAAAIWGSYLDSTIPTSIQANFDPLPCSSGGAVLGSAGTIGIRRDFPGAAFPGTWYHDALAAKITGDPTPFGHTIAATFSSSVDTGCMAVGSRFYYGLDNATPSMRINLLVVVLHEMGHGLGFSSFVDGASGTMVDGLPDVYMHFMYDRDLGLYWHQMTDVQRQASAMNVNDVLWDGPNVKLASGSLTSGRDAATGRVELYTPSAFASGSSISHFNTTVAPNLLMEPSINTGLPTDLDLTRQQMRDIGWFRDVGGDRVADTITDVLPSSGTLISGNTANITWTNNGGFNRNVRIELSVDGGATFPFVIASNVPNTGSYSWTVPSGSTTAARIRVREYDFVAPSGASSANFAISAAPSAGMVGVSGRVTDATGRAVVGAVVSLTGNSGMAQTVRTNGFGYFRFPAVQAGENYLASVSHKFHSFDSQVITVHDELNGLIFVSSR